MFDNPQSLVGTTIEHYQLTRVLGSGATSTVFEAHRTRDDHVSSGEPDQGADTSPAATPAAMPETVAVKVLLPQFAGAGTDVKEVTRRFLREARAAKQLTHPHILPVLSYGESNGLNYMILPLVEAGTLSSWLNAQTEPLPLPVIGDILQQTADALDFAHSQGIIHRDIKPSNLMRSADGTIYLSDFGVARLISSGDGALVMTAPSDRMALTQTGEALGTPYYMSPEQIRGEPVGPATDVYALGVVLFLLVTGQVPFQGDSPLQVALQHLQEEPCPPHLLRTDLPEGVEEVMLKALAKEPDDRYASAGALAHDFNAELALARGSEMGDETAIQGMRGVPNATGAEPLQPGQDLVGQTLGDYRLEALLANDGLGYIFRARTSPSDPRYRLRVLTAGPTEAPFSDTALREVATGAQSLLGLRQPGLLPVVDTGVARGYVYVVTPLPGGRTLADVLHDGEALDLDVVDGYLSQVAGVLEWAHGQHYLHGSLTPENVFIDEHGTIQVADLGLRPLRDAPNDEAARADVSVKAPLLIDQFGTSPEQVIGKPTEPASDVYALGCLLYQMLAGRPVFDGATPEDIAQQHLYSTPTTLRRVRTGLPSALQNILNRALAKDPRQRYSKPNDLARAYHEIITRAALGASQSARVQARTFPGGDSSLLRSRGASSMGRASRSTAGMSSTEGNATRAARSDDTQLASIPSTTFAGQAAVNNATVAAAPRTLPPTPAGAAPLSPVTAEGAGAAVSRTGSRAASLSGIELRRRLPMNRLALGAVALLVLASLGFVLVRTLAPVPGATIGFADNAKGPSGQSDSVTISAQSLSDPAQGTAYYAWILDNTTETSQILGQLVKHGDTYSVQFAHTGVAPLSMLVGGEDLVTIQVTAEPNATVPVHWPRGKTVLQVSVPGQSFVHIGHLLVAFPTTPHHNGLLSGLLDQSHRLDVQAQALRDDVKKGDKTAYTCEAQSIVDIIEGSKGPSYAPLSAECQSAGITEMGDGYGILGAEGYNAGVSDHANLAATGAGATAATKTHAHNVEIAVANIDTWANTADSAAWWLLHHPDDTSGVTKLVTAAMNVYAGRNPNGSGLAPTATNEAGAQTAYREGQLMATLTLNQPNG